MEYIFLWEIVLHTAEKNCKEQNLQKKIGLRHVAFFKGHPIKETLNLLKHLLKLAFFKNSLVQMISLNAHTVYFILTV